MYQETQNGTEVPPLVQTEAREVVLPVAPRSSRQRCSPRALRIASLILLTTGNMMAYSGVFTPYIAFLELSDFVWVHTGFYMYCDQYKDDGFLCDSLVLSDSESWLKVCQVFGFLASFTSFVSWVMLVIWLCQNNKTQCLKFTIVGLKFFTMLCYTVALLVFALAKDEEESSIFTGYDLYWGFFLACGGTFMMFMSGILLMFHPSSKQHQQSKLLIYGEKTVTQPVGQPTSQPVSPPPTPAPNDTNIKSPSHN